MILRLEAQGHQLEIPPTEARAVIGRSDECDYVVNDNSISRRHLEVYFRANNGWTIRDMESSKGTYVNNVRKKEPVELKFGDVVRLGHVAFTVHFKGSENEAPIAPHIRTNVLAEGGAKALVMSQPNNLNVDMGKKPEEWDTKSKAAERRTIERKEDDGFSKHIITVVSILCALLGFWIACRYIVADKPSLPAGSSGAKDAPVNPPKP